MKKSNEKNFFLIFLFAMIFIELPLFQATEVAWDYSKDIIYHGGKLYYPHNEENVENIFNPNNNSTTIDNQKLPANNEGKPHSSTHGNNDLDLHNNSPKPHGNDNNNSHHEEEELATGGKFWFCIFMIISKKILILFIV